jgi:hypothetical protein
MQIVCAVVVIRSAPQHGVAVHIAGCDDGVMTPGRGILFQKQDLSPPIGGQCIAFGRKNP